MGNFLRITVRQFFLSTFLIFMVGSAFAQAKPAAESVTQQSAEEIGATREKLVEFLRLNPKSAAIIAHDPTLLGDLQYVGRNNPQLAAFLQSHPEVARNPEFYLFAKMPPGPGTMAARFEGEVWPELQVRRDPWGDFLNQDVVPFAVFVLIGSALIWLIRTLLEHRRWSRTFNVQTEIYSKLLEKFASNEDLIAYVQSEAGKRFLASATLPQVPEARAGSAVSRVLTPLQIGSVMTVAGLGFLFLHRNVGGSTPLLGIGTLAVALGIGFMISAGIAWVLANRMGIINPASAHGDASVHHETGL